MPKIIAVLFSLIIVCRLCFGVSTYMGLQPGLSTRADVEKVFGQPVQSVSPTLFEYALPAASGKIYVEFRAKDFVVDRIERRFNKPVSRAALSAVSGPSPPKSGRTKVTTRPGGWDAPCGGPAPDDAPGAAPERVAAAGEGASRA